MGNQQILALVLFTGGKDSFLAACKEVSLGKHVTLLSFTNGSTLCSECFGYGANRLIKKFGDDKIEFAGIYNTGGIVRAYNRGQQRIPHQEFIERYSTVTWQQLSCLHCQTAMWLAAMAYARVHSMSEISCGYRETDNSCTGFVEYTDAIARVASKSGLLIHLPMWSVSDEFQRDVQMELFGFEPAIQKPRCALKYAQDIKMSEQEIDNLLSYFSDVIEPEAPRLVDELIGVFQSINLTTEACEKAEPIIYDE